MSGINQYVGQKTLTDIGVLRDRGSHCRVQTK